LTSVRPKTPPPAQRRGCRCERQFEARDAVAVDRGAFVRIWLVSQQGVGDSSATYGPAGQIARLTSRADVKGSLTGAGQDDCSGNRPRARSSQRRPSSISICRVGVSAAGCQRLRPRRAGYAGDVGFHHSGSMATSTGWPELRPARAACQPTAPIVLRYRRLRAMGRWRGAGKEGDPCGNGGRS